MLRWWHHRGITGARRVCNRFWYGGLLSGRRLSLLARMWAGGWALISVFWCETFHGEKARCTMHCTCHYRYIFWVYVDVNQLLNCTVNDDLLWNVCHDLLRTCYITVSSIDSSYRLWLAPLDGLMHWNQFQWYIWAIYEMPQNDPFPKKWLCASDLDFWVWFGLNRANKENRIERRVVSWSKYALKEKRLLSHIWCSSVSGHG